jgi:type IV pilus assembly protein PilB
VPHDRLVDAGLPKSELPNVKAVLGKGCDRCGGTGYRGRVGVFEIMEISENLRDRIIHGAQVTELRSVAIEEGMSTLRMSGLMKVRDGVTTLDEIVRETM